MSQHHPHSFTRKSKAFPWPWCAHCGLLKLKNDATDRAVRLGCDWKELIGKEARNG